MVVFNRPICRRRVEFARIVGVPSLWPRPFGVLEQPGMGASCQLDPEQPNFRIAENNRPICLNQTYKTCSRNALFFFVGWILRRRSSASGSDLGRSTSVAEPHRLRFTLSHFLRRRTSLKLSGRRTATRSCGGARYVSWIRSSATDGAASRRTISIMIGLRSIAVVVWCVEEPSLSCHCFLSRIRITACWRVVMRSGADL